MAFEPKTLDSGKSYLFLCLKYQQRCRTTESQSPRTAKTHFFASLPAGNTTALALVEVAGNIAEHHLPIEMGVAVTSSDPPYPKDIEAALAALPQGDGLPDSEELQRLDQGLNLISQWLAEAGIGTAARASWKLNVLADRFPALGGMALR